MGCFVVPATEAIITTIATKVVSAREAKYAAPVSNDNHELTHTEKVTIPFSHKMKWLNRMLAGGSVLLAFEHVWHGEVVPFAPFLTAMNSAETTSIMLHEMATTGVAMACSVTAVWAVMVGITTVLEKKAANVEVNQEA